MACFSASISALICAISAWVPCRKASISAFVACFSASISTLVFCRKASISTFVAKLVLSRATCSSASVSACSSVKPLPRQTLDKAVRIKCNGFGHEEIIAHPLRPNKPRPGRLPAGPVATRSTVIRPIPGLSKIHT